MDVPANCDADADGPAYTHCHTPCSRGCSRSHPCTPRTARGTATS